jgi:glycine hydroxymethyltransferase
MTTRGMGSQEFTAIADIIADRLLNPQDGVMEKQCLKRVAALCESFPLYPHLSGLVAALA